MSQLALIEGLAPPHQEHLSQWFTPPDLAARLVEWCGGIKPKTILEPSAGSGALIDAWLESRPLAPFTLNAVEWDPAWVEHMRTRYANEHRVTVREGDYMATPIDRREALTDLALLNPPYENGLATAFLRRCMDNCERVAGIFQTSILQGVGNHEAIWSDREWSWNVALLVRRPKFSGADGTAQRDFCCIKGRRRGAGATGTKVEWWA